MKKNIIFLILVVFSTLVWSCEEVIDIDVKNGEEQLVVDAWLTNEADNQSVTLTLSQPYFDNSTPKPALGATVFVFDEDSSRFEFTDTNNDGIYVYNPVDKQPIFKNINIQYALYIKYNNEEYYSTSKFLRVPKIDSVSYEAFTFPIAPNDSTPKSGFIAQFYGRDFDGLNDTYWIRYFKNGKRNKKPSAISVAFDAGFSPGSKSDGLQFILPIRQSINDGLYQDKDSVKVELYSITNEAYYFLLQIRQESSNAGIFATPAANIPSNLVNLNPTSKKKALGFFSVSNTSSYSFVIDKAKAKPER